MGILHWLKRLVFGDIADAPPLWRAQEQPGSASEPSNRVGQRPSTSSAASTQVSKAAPPQPGKLALEAGSFTALSDEEVRKKAGQVGSLWSNPWFGRRDLIPPASDARTQLIDGAMVGHGLITPEQLKEIHEVGAEMDRIRPDLAHARALAQQAVEQSKVEREEQKRQKKAEAAERKRMHAEAVAERKRTDIIFLGREVSKGLGDRRALVEKLRETGLPVLATPRDVAQALGLSIPRLRWLAFHAEAATCTHYVCFTAPKKSGGVRTLSAPHAELARCQRWILDQILAKLKTSDPAHGFVKGRSTLTNATPHVGQETVVNLDLKDFFPSISFVRVRGVFRKLGYSPAAATVLALLCTEAPRRVVTYAGQKYHVASGPRALPQGACTSPALSNLAARGLDARLNGIAGKLGFKYTRYADDLTFSGHGEALQKCGYLLARVRHIARDEGFAVNEMKTRVQRKNVAQTVTGIVVNERPGVLRKQVRRIRAILHRAKSEGLAAQNRDQHPHFESWLQGAIAYIAMVNPKQGQPLKEAFRSLRS